MIKMTRLAMMCLGLCFATEAISAPMVSITKSCPGMRYLGRNATFQISVTNSGDSAAQNVRVTDVVPAGIDLMTADNGGKREGRNIVWNIGTLNAGESRVLSSTFRCNQIGMFENFAKVSYCVEEQAQCALEVKGIAAILLECVDDPDPIEVGSNVTYTIRVTNQGSAIGTNIQIKCTLPDQQQFVSAEGATSGSADGQAVTFMPLPSLAPKASATFKLTVKGISEGDVRFRVEMTSDQIAEPVMETESTNIY